MDAVAYALAKRITLSEKWVQKASMPTARGWATAASLGNYIYVIGGNNGSSRLTKNERYDVLTNTWTTRASMPTARNTLAGVAVNGLIYAIGGLTGSASVATNEMYNPATNTWTAKSAMPTARNALIAVAPDNEKIYAIGGVTLSSAPDVNEEYDPATNTWTAKASMPTARDYLAGGAVGGIIYAIGGHTTSVLTTVNEAYDPTTNTWSTKAPIPQAVGQESAAVVNDKIYVTCNLINKSNFTIDPGFGLWTYEYDPVTNSWTRRLNKPYSGANWAVASPNPPNGKFYIFGGYRNISSTYYYDATVYEYTPPVPQNLRELLGWLAVKD